MQYVTTRQLRADLRGTTSAAAIGSTLCENKLHVCLLRNIMQRCKRACGLMHWGNYAMWKCLQCVVCSVTYICQIQVSDHKQARREGGKGGRSFPGPHNVWGAPPSLKNTEKGVPDGFFLTWNVQKIHFRPGALPRTPLGELTSVPQIPSQMVRGHHSPRFFPSRRRQPLYLGAYGMRLW